MLRLDFGTALDGVEINITFQCFKFKYEESPESRPYIDKTRHAPKVNANQVGSYFSYLSIQPHRSAWMHV